MAKLTKIFENGEITSILTFRGIDYSTKMGQWDDGIRHGGIGFPTQISKDIEDDDYEEEILEAVDTIDCNYGEEETEEALEVLRDYE